MIKYLTFFLLLTCPVFAQQKNDPEILQHPAEVKIVCLELLNSSLRETNLSVSPDGKYLYFMSDRGGQAWSSRRGSYKGKPHFDGDIWYSERLPSEADIVRQWQDPKPMPSGVNTGSGEDEPGISQDGQMVYFQSWRADWQITGGPYYAARLNGSEWQTAKGMGSGIADYFRTEFNRHQGYATDGMCVSADGKKFIVAAGAEYDGNMDIYLSVKAKNGLWSYLKKMPVSTSKDERSVFLAADGRTLYFASDGYGGKGGLDIFKTVLDENGMPGEIVNIGAPFNTPQDDYGFILTASGNEAYFVRNGDIFYANLSKADPKIKPLPVHLISGRLTDKVTKQGIEAQIVLFNEQNKTISSARSNSLTGEYSMVIPMQKSKLRQIIVAPGYDTLHSLIELKKEKTFTQTSQQVALKKAGAPVMVLFDFDADVLKPEFKTELINWLAHTGKQKKIVLTGHTDSKGDSLYNVVLSQRRVAQVKRYLEEMGYPAGNIEVRYSGENTPVHSNETDLGRAYNRRVEVSTE